VISSPNTTTHLNTVQAHNEAQKKELCVQYKTLFQRLENGMSNKKNSKIGHSFAGIPRIVMQHNDYQSLNGTAVKLLLELAFQYRGSNNGDLTTAASVLRPKGWTSRATIDRAKKRLLEKNLIQETRAGKFTNPGGVCSLYALTWLPINECHGKLDVSATNRAIRSFKPQLENK
tara:strand:+ start:567 stop:1088 length:522 start_codon:yes stop_codon:yes gene_type:complete